MTKSRRLRKSGWRLTSTSTSTSKTIQVSIWKVMSVPFNVKWQKWNCFYLGNECVFKSFEIFFYFLAGGEPAGFNLMNLFLLSMFGKEETIPTVPISSFALPFSLRFSALKFCNDSCTLDNYFPVTIWSVSEVKIGCRTW